MNWSASRADLSPRSFLQLYKRMSRRKREGNGEDVMSQCRWEELLGLSESILDLLFENSKFRWR